VTDPRNIISSALRILIKNSDGSYVKVEGQHIEVWKDNSTGNDFSGHTFAVVYVGQEGLKVIDNTDPNPDVYAEWLIFDLSEAISSGATEITVDNPTVRSVSGSSTNQHSVYIGYIKQDDKYFFNYNSTGPSWSHAGLRIVHLQNDLGIFMRIPGSRNYQKNVSTLSATTYVDCYDLRNIATSSDATQSSTNLISLSRIGTDHGGGDIEPIPITLPSTYSSLFVSNTDVTAEKIDNTTMRLCTSAYSRGDDYAGGVILQTVDFSIPTTTSISDPQYWAYDPDKGHPNQQFVSTPSSTKITDWKYRNVHSAEIFTIGSNKYVLTTNELASPFYDGLVTLTTSSGTWQDAIQKILYNGTNEDDRKLGNYLRIWETQTSSGPLEIKGTGSNNAPLASYDPIEVAPDGDPFSASKLQNTAIAANTSTASDDLSSSNAVGINTIHKMHYIPGTSDVFLAGYASGTRVINLGGLTTSSVVKEKAFFDYIPTLNYAKASDYFYLNGFHGVGPFVNFLPNNLQCYFIGTFDIRADIERTGGTASTDLPLDEKFVYSIGVGEGYMSGESASRNWLNQGGLMILRYFDDKIGGTIGGYTGTSAWNDRSYREVNLQGDFIVQRNTTVASGATVNLLKNTNFNQRTDITNPSECLIIYGTMNIQTFSDGSGRGTINCPILVKSGGKLVVKSGAEMDFTKKVFVEMGGELNIESDTKVAFAAPENFCNGRLIVNGTSLVKAHITGALNPSNRSEITGKGCIIMKGNVNDDPLDGRTELHLNYADIKNVSIKATDIAMNIFTPFSGAIDHCDFSGNTSTYNFMPLLSISFTPDYYRLNVYVTNCTFIDAIGLRDLSSTTIVGLQVSGCKTFTLSNSYFNFLRWGGIFDNMVGQAGTISGNTLQHNTFGFKTNWAIRRYCGNTLEDNDFGTLATAEYPASLFDNTYTRHLSAASFTQSSATQYYRGNTIDTYNLFGIFSSKSNLLLKNGTDPVTAQWNIIGRNHFSLPSTVCNGTSGCIPIDISLIESSDIDVKCGLNEFSQRNTGLHISADASSAGLAGPLNVQSNKWRDKSGGFQVRVSANLNQFGTPINTNATTTAQCSNINATSDCGSTICPKGSSYVWCDYTGNDSAKLAELTEYWGDLSSSSSYKCRSVGLQEAFALASLLDTIPIYQANAAHFDTVARDTSAPNELRSTALLLRGGTYEHLLKFDSAIIAYRYITDHYQSLRSDSLVAAWRIQYIAVQADTVNSDSTYALYMARVERDIRRIIADTSTSYKIAADSPNKQQYPSSPIISLDQNRPNPWTDETEISFTVPYPDFAHLSVIDMLGNEVSILLDGECKGGLNRISFKSKDLSSGIYFYRLQYGNSIMTKKMQKFQR
jgi:hypothetical protein